MHSTVRQRREVVAAGFARATSLAAAVVLIGGSLGWLWLRHWGRVPFRVPSQPWYHCFPFYVFPHPMLAPGWALLALPVVLGVPAALVATADRRFAWPTRLAIMAAAAFALSLAVAALADGPRSWWAPLDSTGEYPAGTHLVGAIPSFLRRFPDLLPMLPSQAQGHPAGAMVFYALVARFHPGLGAAAIATVAAGALGAFAAGALARDELGALGGRLAVTLWVLSPGVVLYLATSADAMFATALGLAVLAAHRGLVRRSWPWTVAGGALLWVASMLTYAAVLLLVFLLVRAGGRLRCEAAWVLRWAAGTAAVVLGLAAVAWLALGYDPLAVLRAVHHAYQGSPGSARRPALPWIPGDLLAFGGMLGVPSRWSASAPGRQSTRPRWRPCSRRRAGASPGARWSASSSSWSRCC